MAVVWKWQRGVGGGGGHGYAPGEGASDTSVLAGVEPENINVVIHGPLLVSEGLLHGALHLGGVQEHLSDCQGVNEGVKLLDVAGEPPQERGGGLLGGEEDASFQVALSLSTCGHPALFCLAV